ncbi:hypothetical protein VNI00_000031 [Paramarasmius palmivorus]|uniref:Uncharacterized protein n=1 Tax=Paramarasmius palmivorus TaxID=297713 RepID=A0AAW0EGP4_9AGAR
MPHPVAPVHVILPLPLTPSNDVHDPRPIARRRRSSTFTTITNWALGVQPGSPGPVSPVHSRARSGSNTLGHLISTPSTARRTPSTAKDFPSEVDLTNWGYTSVFVHLPHTPETPARFCAPGRVPETPAVKGDKGLKRFKSMGMLKPLRSRMRSKSIVDSGEASTSTRPRPRSRSRSRSGSISPTKPSAKRPGHAKSKSFSASTSKTKTKTHPPLPPALQNELLLMQFADGGSLESNAQKLMEQRAKVNAGNAVDGVYKDENGVMWLDEDERVEYEALLPATTTAPSSPWVEFNGAKPESPTMGVDEDPVRRGSVTSMTPTERELEGAASIVCPASPSGYVGVGLPSVRPTPTSDRSERRRRRRPAPLKLHSDNTVPTLSSQGFDDSFEPTSAEAAALAAGMHSHARSRPVARRGVAKVGSAPADVMEFEVIEKKTQKKSLAKRAKALFGMD